MNATAKSKSVPVAESDGWVYDLEDNVHLYGDKTLGIGVYPFCLEYVANVVYDKEIQHLTGFQSVAEAKKASMEFFEKWKLEKRSIDDSFI